MAEESLEERQAAMRLRMSTYVKKRAEEKVVARVAETAVAASTEEVNPEADAPLPKVSNFGIKKDGRSFVITRERLYDLVWTEPMTKAAKRFQVSDVAVAKTCRSYNIPVPGIGYWARLAAGQKMKRPRLPKDEEKETRITFTPLRKPDPVPEIQATQVVILEDASKHLHPVVKQTKAALDKKYPDKQGRYWPNSEFLDVRVTSGQVDRTMRILSTLLKAAEGRGDKVILEKPHRSRHESKWAQVSVDGIPIFFNIKERIQTTRHELTPADQKHIANGDQYRVPKHDYIPTGELTFTITEPSAYGMQTAWADSKLRRIEESLGNILATFSAVSKLEQERHKQRAIQQKREYEEWQQRYKEEQKVKRLEAQMKLWKTSLDVRAYAGAVETAIIKSCGDIDSQTELSRWLRWMRKYAEQIDPSTRDDIGSDRIYW